ncbi:agrin-like isoform X4 [Apostichopus japonicus]|uniref:agrin-like isoform X4 n=1 Tax=Stichopus japonicus TaxID=307972 RepID=UPI003AB12CC7
MYLGAWTAILALGLCVPSCLSMVVITKSTTSCNEDSLMNREGRADVILSGLVDKVVREPQKPVYKCEVKVVRVFKGAEALHNGISPVMQEEKIMVGGFGDPAICSNTVHEGDTKILLLGVDKKGHLFLNSSLLTITYNNLEVVDGIVNDLPVITRPPIEKGACDRILCTFGAFCQELEDGSPKCICPDSCSGVAAPVCGSNRVTYQSECHMKVASCEAKQLVTVFSQGECVDPCDNIQCGYGEVCLPNGAEASCICQNSCDSVEEPVCGSNGRDYENMCKMTLAGCKSKNNITAVFEGLCDPCKGVEHEEGAICRLDESRSPVLECTDGCGDEYSPVCGSDGMMYNSSCQMEHAACVMNMDITEVPMEGCASDGPCAKEPCEYGHCSLSTSLEMSCVCPSECDDVYHPVCANDGVTYNSMCEMERTACLGKMELVALYNKPCDKDVDLCRKMECEFGAVCSDVSGLAQCVCNMTCDGEMDPVCGSDKVSYSSPCEVTRAICLQQKEIEIISMGQCDLCEDHVCSYGGYCRMKDGEPTCQCAEFCNANYRPVCGSDDVTYSNICNLRSRSCLRSIEITAVSEGPCDLCRDMNCTHGSYCKNGMCKCKGGCPFIREPVCGSDGQTYENECKMNLTMCKRKLDLFIDYYGECEVESGSGELSGDDEESTTASDSTMPFSEFKKCEEINCAFGGVCESVGLGSRCSCNMSCPAIRLAVCGSDGATYGNECQLKEASCEQQKSIVTESMGTCEDIEQEPCDGETPLTDGESGEDIRCTAENKGDECPSGSYCHIHSMGNFAVCCPEDTTNVPMETCEDSEYGCCPDEETSAEGPAFEGCEEKECDCNEYGAYSKECDDSGQCSCRPGVTAELCNSCVPGYWNFRGIVDGNEGCEPCECNVGGSVRDDCGQDYGECVCKAGVTGMKCDKCPAGQVMGSMGCENDNDSVPMTCEDRMCDFGADCVDMNDTSICVCPSDCPGSGEQVCGSDSQTYSNECQLRVISCRSEKIIYVESTGPCETSMVSPTEVMEDCEMSEYGCCPDGVTTAMGDNFEGCMETTTLFPMVNATETPENTSILVMSCDSSPCKRGGTCMESDMAPGFTCYCPLGTGGPVCLDTVHFNYPSFSGHSYIAYDTIKGFLQVSVEMEFQASSSEGLLFYNGQMDDGSGDFIALVLVGDHVELQFDLGSREIVTLKSNVMIEKDTWYRVSATRTKRKGTLSVDGEPKVKSVANSGSSGLHLGTEMFLGSVAEGRDRVYSRTGISGGFSGCIRYVRVNDLEYNLKFPQVMGDMLYGANIGDCGQDPCLNNECQNNATCIPGEGERYTCDCVGDFLGPYCADVFSDPCEGNMCHFGSTCVPEPTGSYRCDCPAGVQGDRCNQVIEPEMAGPFVPAFSGNSFIELEGMKLGDQHKVEVEFLSSKPDGMIFYQGQKTDGNGDFISLNLVDSFLEFRYDLGSGIAELRSLQEVNLNEWLSIVAVRDGRDGSLEIEGLELIEGTSKMPVESQDPEGEMAQLNINQNFFVGGVPEFSEISRKAAITDGLTGAVRKLVLNGEEIVDLQGSALNEVNIQEFIPEVCRTHPCMPGFLCDPETGSCECPEELVQDGDRCVSGAMTTSMAADMGTDMETDGDIDMVTEGPVVMETGASMQMMTDNDMATDMEDGDGEETKAMVEVSGMVSPMQEMTGGASMTPDEMTDVMRETSKPMVSMGMDSTMTSKVTGEEKTDKMVDMTGGMTAQMTTPKRMVSSEGVMSTAMDTTPSMKSVSPMMMGEKTDGETDEAMTMTMTMGKASTDGSMKTSKLMSTLQAMTQSSEMTDTKKPMDNVMSSQGMTATAKMTQEAMTPTMMDMMKDTTMKASPSQEMKTSPMDDQTKPKSTKSMTSFPPPPPMTTTAPPRRATTMDQGSTPTMSPKVSTTQQRTTMSSSSAASVNIDGPVSFTGKQQYKYDNLITSVIKAQSNNVFEVMIKTEDENGLIMWNGGADFIGLAVVDGYVMFTYQLGSGTLKMVSTVYVSDGNFHRIYASRYVRDGTLHVDDEDPVLDSSNPGASQLNTDGALYVGGAPHVPPKKLPRGFETNFVGCIGDIRIEDQQLHMFYDVKSSHPESFCSLMR